MDRFEEVLDTALLVLLAGSIYSDVVRRTIPNFACALVFLLGLVQQIAINPVGWVYSVLGSVIAILAGIGLHQKKILGGGDVKLIAALAVWLTPIELGRFALAIMLAGGVVGLGYLAVGFVRRLRDKTAPAAASIPYALAIVVGFLFMRPSLLMSTIF